MMSRRRRRRQNAWKLSYTVMNAPPDFRPLKPPTSQISVVIQAAPLLQPLANASYTLWNN